MRRLIAILAFIGFWFSLFVHGATYFGINIAEEFMGVWCLHIFIFPLMFPLAAASRTIQGNNAREKWQILYSNVPAWGKVIRNIFFAYAFINFALFIGKTADEPNPQRLSGEYRHYRANPNIYVSLEDAEGKIATLESVPVLRSSSSIGELTIFTRIPEQEYYERTLPITRGFSGHWMIFYLIPALYFWFPSPKRKNEDLVAEAFTP